MGELIYKIEVDRFYNSKTGTSFFWNQVPNEETHLGGDFKGIMEKLDYIKGLGVEAICLSPLFQRGKAGVITDYYKLNPFYGTEKYLDDLVTVFAEQEIATYFTLPLSGLVDEHESNEENIRFLSDVIDHWMKKIPFTGFLSESHFALPQSVLEMYEGKDCAVLIYEGVGSLQDGWKQVFLDDWKMKRSEQSTVKYPVFTSNHDTERLIDLLEGETDRALIFLEKISKLSHPVVLYYGDEVGLGGGTDKASCLPMNWNKNAIWQKV